jgi:hypothetical protein
VQHVVACNGIAAPSNQKLMLPTKKIHDAGETVFILTLNPLYAPKFMNVLMFT